MRYTINRVAMRRKGMRELMNSPEIQNYCLKQAHTIANRTQGDTHYKVDVQPGKNRCHARVSTTTIKDYIKELHTHRLLKAMWG